VIFRNKFLFYDEELLAPRLTHKLEDHPLSAARDCLFNIFAPTPPYLEAVSSIRNLRTRHAVVTGDSACRILVGKPEGKRSLGRQRRRWVDNIEIDLREIGWDVVDWIDLA
jgi:hypothetical protein